MKRSFHKYATEARNQVFSAFNWQCQEKVDAIVNSLKNKILYVFGVRVLFLNYPVFNHI